MGELGELKERGDVRGKPVEEIIAWYVIPGCLRHDKNPHETYPLTPFLKEGGTGVRRCLVLEKKRR